MKNIITFSLFMAMLCIKCGCDPMDQTNKSTLRTFMLNESGETIGWEHNWKGHDVNHGIIRSRYFTPLWDYIDLPHIEDRSKHTILEYFIEMIKQENNDAYLTIYTYDETTQEKGNVITWNLNSNDDNPFFAEDNWEHITHPEGKILYETLILFITNETLQKTDSGE